MCFTLSEDASSQKPSTLVHEDNTLDLRLDSSKNQENGLQSSISSTDELRDVDEQDIRSKDHSGETGTCLMCSS